MSDQHFPQHFRYIIPIVEVLKELGGSGRAGEVTDLVVKKLQITDEELDETTSSRQSRVINQIQWARFRLVKADYINLSIHGVWTLTEKGFLSDFTETDLHDLYKQERQIVGWVSESPDAGWCLEGTQTVGWQQMTRLYGTGAMPTYFCPSSPSRASLLT